MTYTLKTSCLLLASLAFPLAFAVEACAQDVTEETVEATENEVAEVEEAAPMTDAEIIAAFSRMRGVRESSVLKDFELNVEAFKATLQSAYAGTATDYEIGFAHGVLIGEYFRKDGRLLEGLDEVVTGVNADAEAPIPQEDILLLMLLGQLDQSPLPWREYDVTGFIGGLGQQVVLAADIEADADVLSRANGIALGWAFLDNGQPIDVDVLVEGIELGLAGEEVTESPEYQMEVFEGYQRIINEQKQAEAAAYLAEIAAKDGWLSTESGLVYKVLEGADVEGESPLATSSVRVHYEGALLDGTVFDSSYERGQPVEFSVDGVIPGWTELLQLMKPGQKVEVVIPWNLAYGEMGTRDGSIAPYSTLCFTVELLEVLAPEAPISSY